MARMKEIRKASRVSVVSTGLIFMSNVFSNCAAYEGGIHYYNYYILNSVFGLRLTDAKSCNCNQVTTGSNYRQR